MLTRCPWVSLNDPVMVAYHDLEWGVPVHDDHIIFEFLLLEGFQAGLSWSTILHKRENFQQAFDEFNPQIIAGYNESKITELLSNPGIIRNRLKVRASVTNAQAFLRTQAEFGSFDAYVWQFVGGKPKVNSIKSLADYPDKSPESDALSNDLYRRGFKFVGSKIIYAHMQATGMINDHTIDCFRYHEVYKSPFQEI